MGTPVPIPEDQDPFRPMPIEARNEAREVVSTWVRDRLGVRDVEMMWMARRRQLLIHEKVQIRKWQTQAFNRCMQILRTDEGARIKTGRPALIVWTNQDGREHQAFGVNFGLEEGPDPLQFSLEDWIDQERQ
jgi:hypothetical protein